MFVGDDVGGHGVGVSSEGSEPDASRGGVGLDACDVFGVVDFDDACSADDACVFDSGGGEGEQSFLELFFDVRDTVEIVVALEDVDACEGDGAGGGVAHEGGAVHEGVFGVIGVEGVEDVGSCDDGGVSGVSGGEGFAEGHDVGCDVGVVGGEELSGSAEACGDLIEDEEESVAIAEFACAFEVEGAVDIEPAGGLEDGLADHAGEFVVVLLDEGFECLEVFADGLWVGVESATGCGCEVVLGEDGCEEVVHGVFGVGDGHSAGGVAVVAETEGYHFVSFGLAQVSLVLDRYFECDFDGDGSGVGEEGVLEVARGELREGFGELSCGLVCESAEHDVRERVDLVVGGLEDIGVVVAMDDGPPGGDGVDEGCVVFEEEGAALGGADGVGRSGRFHLGVGHPEVVGLVLVLLRVGGVVLHRAMMSGCGAVGNARMDAHE